MHILMISDVYFPRINGVSTSIQSFRSELIASGHRVTLICPDYPESLTLERAHDQHDDEDILRIPSREVLLDPEDRMMSYGTIINLMPILRGRNIDLIHIHTPFVAHYAGVKIARALAAPVVESYHTFFEEYLYNYIRWAPRNWLKWAARFFSKSQCNAVDALVVPSSPMRDALQNYSIGTEMHIIPTGLNLDAFRTPPESNFRARLSIRDDQALLLYVGRVALEKNIDFLLNMMPFVLKETPEAILVIAGEGPAESHLQRKVADMGLQASVKFVGYMRRDGALQDAYRAADLFVFASRTETQGLVLLEALALGTPVVALGIMGTLDVLDTDGGCVIAPDDPFGFAEAINQTLNQPDRYQQLVDQAPHYADTWTSAHKTQQLLGMYRQQLASHTTS